jgi:undecaprenyl diphosphate synthase
MDGNGRWATKRKLPKLEGHKAGEKAVRRVVDLAEEFGVEFLTLYAFSTENWKRSPQEVMGLMNLLGDSIERNLEELHEKGIRIRLVGRMEKIPNQTRRKLDHAVAITADNLKGNLVIALNYGGRAEIADAAARIAELAVSGQLKSSSIDEKMFAKFLYAPDIPDPDLLIRTSGEFRLSNFLLWELSYSELYFTDTLWPDFGREVFEKAINSFYNRNRRFGGRKC